MAEQVSKKGGGCLTGIASLIGAVIAIVVARGFLHTKPPTTQVNLNNTYKTLQDVSSSINRTLPKAIDLETTLETTSATPDDHFYYQYKLVNVSSVNFDRSKLSNFAHTLVANACNSQELQRIFSLGVTTVFLYVGNDGVELGRLSLNANNCPPSQSTQPTFIFPPIAEAKLSAVTSDSKSIDITTSIDYSTPHNKNCWQTYQQAVSKVPENASLGYYANVEEKAKRRLSQCVTRK